MSEINTKRSDTVLSVYGYTDYTKYLRDFYKSRKSGRRGYSYRMFSRDAGFASPNILKLVMEGQRKIGKASIEKFIKGLGLQGTMAEYFRTLVQLQHAASVEEKRQLMQVLIRLTPHHKKRFLNPASLEYLSHWIYPVLREMVGLQSFSDDPHWIARRLIGRVSVAEISKALQFLKKNGFIVKGEDGLYRLQDAMVLSSDEVRSLAVRQFHQVILQQSREMLEDLDMTEREFGSLIIKLPEQSLDELKHKLKAFRKELHAWALEQQADTINQIVQINFQMYPQMRKARQ